MLQDRFTLALHLIACYLCLSSVFSEAAGVAAYKDQSFHADSMAKPVVYAKILGMTPVTIQFDLGSKQVSVERSKIAAYVEIPSQPANITNQQELDSVKSTYNEIKSFADKYTKCAAIVQPYVASFSNAISRFEAGEVRYNNEWISGEKYASILKSQREAVAMYERQQQAKLDEIRIRREKMEEEARLRREKEEAFAKSQRDKGLELYQGQWLPRAEVLVLQARDYEDSKVWEKVRSKSIFSGVYQIFQVLDQGMLIEPVRGSLENGGINVDIAYLVDGLESTAADGDFYTDDLFWCGNYSYLAKNGSSKTVNAYSLRKEVAIAKVRKLLFDKSPEREDTPVAREPASSGSNSERMPVVAGPLDGAKGTGSGFFVGDEGYFMTNFHVVEDAAQVYVYYKDQMLRAEVVKVSKVVDLAILKVQKKVLGLEISSEDPQLGNDVFVYGYPQPLIQGLDVKVTKGVVSSSKGLDGDETRFQIDAAIQPGNSGGPICDSNGRVIGVVVAGLNQIAVATATGAIPQNVNYGIKAAEVGAILRTKSVGMEVPDGGRLGEKDRAATARMVTERIGLVIVR